MCPRGMSAEPAAAWRRVAAAKSRMGTGGNPFACAAAMSRTRPKARFARRRRAGYRRGISRLCVNRNLVVGIADSVANKKPRARSARRRRAGYRWRIPRCGAMGNLVAGAAAVVSTRPWARLARRQARV